MSKQAENENRFKSMVFHALADPVRLEMLQYLRDGEKCVCEIVPHLNIIQPVISRHLKILKDTGLVECRKDGNKRFYTITFPEIFNVLDEITPDLKDRISKRIFEQITC
jgi:ArsR family transcriptional regulator